MDTRDIHERQMDRRFYAWKAHPHPGVKRTCTSWFF